MFEIAFCFILTTSEALDLCDCNKGLIYWNDFSADYYCYYFHPYYFCSRFYYTVVFYWCCLRDWIGVLIVIIIGVGVIVAAIVVILASLFCSFLTLIMYHHAFNVITYF